jgi:hypothetical protein
VGIVNFKIIGRARLILLSNFLNEFRTVAFAVVKKKKKKYPQSNEPLARYFVKKEEVTEQNYSI